jgi:hypothetical protein
LLASISEEDSLSPWLYGTAREDILATAGRCALSFDFELAFDFTLITSSLAAPGVLGPCAISSSLISGEFYGITKLCGIGESSSYSSSTSGVSMKNDFDCASQKLRYRLYFILKLVVKRRCSLTSVRSVFCSLSYSYIESWYISFAVRITT